jgi:hypothetical protein
MLNRTEEDGKSEAKTTVERRNNVARNMYATLCSRRRWIRKASMSK